MNEIFTSVKEMYDTKVLQNKPRYYNISKKAAGLITTYTPNCTKRYQGLGAMAFLGE